MEHHAAPAGEANGLEGKLRSMILGNTPEKSRETRSSPGRGGRGRGNQRQHAQGPFRGHPAQLAQQPHNDRQGVSQRQFAQTQRVITPRPSNSPRSQPNQVKALTQQANPPRNWEHSAQNQPPKGPRNANQSSQYVPLQKPSLPPPAMMNSQSDFLEHLAGRVLPELQMRPGEMQSKEEFRIRLETICRTIASSATGGVDIQVDLVPFGSISSGFAMPGSDMDLALMISEDVPGLFRMLENAFLDHGLGAHLLVKTRVPILKLCESPPPELLQALRDERQKWNDLSPEQREIHDSSNNNILEPDTGTRQGGLESKQHSHPAHQQAGTNLTDLERATADLRVNQGSTEVTKGDKNDQVETIASHLALETNGIASSSQAEQKGPAVPPPPRQARPWYREKRLGPLDFPKDGVGVQCDINTANPLGIHNTLLLRCYSRCDPRVKQMVLFVKAWASTRKINSSRNGTLSSYGYVLMVLHFLVNIATPPVCPNLQLARQSQYAPEPGNTNAYCEGRDVRFWRNEAEIKSCADKGFLTHNRDPVGMLLRNFFSYYAERGGFFWTGEVLSLRTPGGLMSKQAKGWTGARTTMLNKLEVKNRYLFAIEDPFELDHNVARTVTHNGIVAIRDEFRRAWRILQAVGRNQTPEGDFFEPSTSLQPPLPDTKEKEVETSNSSVIERSCPVAHTADGEMLNTNHDMSNEPTAQQRVT